jgi:hypothetical protein
MARSTPRESIMIRYIHTHTHTHTYTSPALSRQTDFPTPTEQRDTKTQAHPNTGSLSAQTPSRRRRQRVSHPPPASLPVSTTCPPHKKRRPLLALRNPDATKQPQAETPLYEWKKMTKGFNPDRAPCRKKTAHTPRPHSARDAVRLLNLLVVAGHDPVPHELLRGRE